MKKNQRNKAVIALIIANIIWGAASPIFKLTLQNLPPFTLAYLRFWGASLILLPFVLPKLWFRKKDIISMIFLSLSGVTFNITFFFWGLEKAPSINAPVIASAGPVFLYLYSILVLKEKFLPKVLWGTFVSLFGVLVIIGQPFLKNGLRGEIIGNFYFLIASLGAVVHAIISKRLCKKYPSITITFWSFLIGSFTFLPLFIKELFLFHPFNTIDYRGWYGLVFGIFLSSALAYYLFEWGIKRIKEQEVGIFTYMDPAVAVLIAIPLLGEMPDSIFLIGSILILLGIFIAENRLHWHPLNRLRR